MKIIRLASAVIFLSLMLAFSVSAESEGLSYYAFSRPDLRLCPSPLCGGMFVKEVNKLRTICADGTLRRDCYVAGLDTSSLGIDEERAAAFRSLFEQGHGLVRGSFRLLNGDLREVSSLVAEEAWESRGTARVRGPSYLFRDNGIRCITEPCSWIDEIRLNSEMSRSIADIDLGRTGAPESDVAEGYKSLSSTGLIASGGHTLTTGPGGAGLRFVASRFYLKVQGGVSCGGFAGGLCPEDQFCDITILNACSGADLPGICRIVPQACILALDPVCGCDGVTYGNDCERLAARVQLAHKGPCK